MPPLAAETTTSEEETTSAEETTASDTDTSVAGLSEGCQKVADLFTGTLAAGSHGFRFNAGKLPSGIYAVRAEGAGVSAIRRVFCRSSG